MAFRLGVNRIILLFVAFAILNVSVAIIFEGNCFKTWSRCSGWSSWGTGWLWKSCFDRCVNLGYTGGSCQLCPSSCWMSSKAWKCICFGNGSC